MKRLTLIILTLIFVCPTFAQTVDELANYNEPPSRLRGVIEKFGEDVGILNRFYSAQTSPNRAARFRTLYGDYQALLERQDFAKLNHDEQIDYLLFQNYLRHEQTELERTQKQLAEMSSIIPFAKTISDLEDSRRKLETIDSAKTAALLNDLVKTIQQTQKDIESGKIAKPKRTVANRAVRTIASLRQTLQRWNTFYTGYDPVFTWWNTEPYKTVDAALQSYQNYVSEKLVGIRADDRVTIIGDPIGREELIKELDFEMIPYTPEELVEIANKEFAWCEAEMKKASRELGYGDDWKKALEAVKQKYVEPGKQPELIKKLAYEAIDFVEKNDLVTVPKLARDGWRMEMMTPERQLVAPFFLGGETILVSYPTNGMSHEQKMMSMRGNNPHFSHATVHHELIPGHHLQGYMTSRYRPYREPFNTPFWTEGWSLYWEFLLWDLGFNKSPEDKIGALFWRMHRCARIIFSLNFHLEKMTPQECVDFLVERVGHERDNALAEVRRSFAGDYGPLYQMAYMMGGLQFYNLHHDLVDSKKMTNKQFHDAILKEGRIPVEMVRAILTNQKLSKDFKTNWRFYGGLPK
ncbi:MAG TPA: DUF885 family protein [Pyrinomonadaceae bacterium]|nr:DUF885 family protein [Pyrinomonadaceae bacterium]